MFYPFKGIKPQNVKLFKSSQLPHNHSIIVANLCDTEKSLNNGVHVFISGLSLKAKEFDVESFFKGIGKARNTNLKQGYGFVEIEDARYVVYEINNQPLCGRITTGESAKGFPYQKIFVMTGEVIMGATEAGEETAAVMTAEVLMTKTCPSTVRL